MPSDADFAVARVLLCATDKDNLAIGSTLVSSAVPGAVRKNISAIVSRNFYCVDLRLNVRLITAIARLFDPN